MRLRVIAMMALLLVALILFSAAQAPDYSGRAKVVMKLTQMPEMPRAESSTAAGLVPATFGMPAVPQGALLQGEVLYSSDPAIKANQTYSLYVNYDPQNKPVGFQSGLADKLKSGAVVGINDYTLDGNRITVNVGNSPNWQNRIFIVDMQYTNPGETKNPFMIDLSGFRPFNAQPSFNYSMEMRPMFNMSGWSWDRLPAYNGSASGLDLAGLSGIFDRLFG
jgi:hypothetical protein